MHHPGGSIGEYGGIMRWSVSDWSVFLFLSQALPNQQVVDYPSFKFVIVGDGGTGDFPPSAAFSIPRVVSDLSFPVSVCWELGILTGALSMRDAEI
jgi:hypothetical protein